MTPDDVIDFLKEFERGFDDRQVHFPYVENYLEVLTEQKDSPDRFFTQLGLIYMDKLFNIQPPYAKTPKKD